MARMIPSPAMSDRTVVATGGTLMGSSEIRVARTERPRSRLNHGLTWAAGVGFTVWIFYALMQSSEQAGSVVVRTDADADDRALAERTFAGQPGIYGVIRVAPDLVAAAPKTGKVFVRLVNAALASGTTMALKGFPASGDGPILFHIGPEDMKEPGGFSHELDVSAHWSQNGDPTMDVKGDLKGKCAQNPVRPGEQLAIVVLGQLVDPSSKPTSGY